MLYSIISPEWISIPFPQRDIHLIPAEQGDAGKDSVS